MSPAAAVVACVALSPTPIDYLTAHADLHAPPGTPPLAERSPRTRIAALVALHRLGGLDADAPEGFRWFAADLGWESEHEHARRVVAAVRDAPAEDWLPDSAWFAAESAAYHAAAAEWRARAEEYRTRAIWEEWRSDALCGHARDMEAESCRLGEMGYRYGGWAGSSWQRPRAVVRAEVREWLGSERWAAREFPGW